MYQCLLSVFEQTLLIETGRTYKGNKTVCNITKVLLPTGSEEREVLGVATIPDAILPSCQYWIIIAQI